MRALHMLFALLVAAVWGGNFVSAKYGVAHFPPFFLTALRFMLVALILVPLVKRPPARQMRQIFGLAIVLGTLHLAALFAAMYHGLDIPSCAIVAQLGVPFSCLLGALLYQDRLGIWRISGLLVAFTGMVIVAGTPNILQHRLGFAIALGGAAAWAFANIMIKRIEDVAHMAILGWMSLFAAPSLLLVSSVLESGQWQALTTVTLPALGSIAYTAFGSTIIAYGLWYYLLQRYPVSQVAPWSLLTPVFGIAFGQLFFEESLTLQIVGGGALTLLGVGVIVMRRPKLGALSEAT